MTPDTTSSARWQAACRPGATVRSADTAIRALAVYLDEQGSVAGPG